MASKKKHKDMVLHQEEGATTPAADHPPVCFVALRPGKANEGVMEHSTCASSEEADVRGKDDLSKGAIRRSSGLKHSATSNPQADNLSPESICKGIRVTLDNNNMWNEFFKCRTEMILTKQGSRMFPYCRFRISGLQPSKKYSLLMDIQPLDGSRYKWNGRSWQVAGKAVCHIKSQPFAHPESPASGQHWMQSPVSFYRLKLTNNISDQEGNAILHPLHCYLPRLHVVLTDRAVKDIKLNHPGVITFTFPQTGFMAVTAYQNMRFTQLKVDYSPFAKGLKDESGSWGLKLKENSGKELHKDGGTAPIEQHPVKRSLKSLLANHKPRSSKAVDSNPSGPEDIQRNSTTNKDQSAAKAPGESLCSSSRPAQKLFSELIREAHVSLQRCNLEQLSMNHNRSLRVEPTNTKTTTLRGEGRDVLQKDSKSVKAPARKIETVVTKRKGREDKHLLNSVTNVQTDCSGAAAPAASQNSSEDSDHQHIPYPPSEATVKQQKRPTRLPLPALALFLKQHSTKSRKTKSKPDSPPPAPPSDSLTESQSSAAASACLPSDYTTNTTGPSSNLSGDVTEPDVLTSRRVSADLHPDEVVLNITGQMVETVCELSGLSCPGAAADPAGPGADDRSASVSESLDPELTTPDDPPVLPNLDQTFSNLGAATSTLSSTLATSFASPALSPPIDTVLLAPPSPQTLTQSSPRPSDSPTLKAESLLPDPECSSFGFEPLSPASSPEPLPPLPASLALELDSSEAAHPPGSPEDSLHSKDSSVFKWHTVLPPPEPYIDSSFTTFQPASQTHPLMSVTPPLLPSQSPCHPEPQSLNTSKSTPPPDPPPSFQENEQSLPFPAELSPLTLQLPLSPTFSSLDGDGLSPTPSIADLVHFFSTNDDLGMGVEFSNTETVSVGPPPPTEQAHEPSQQVQLVPTSKPSKRKKKSRQRKVAKTSVDQTMDDSTYRSMQPNLEEVEEQLFISFTSKEALKLHVVDSSEGPVPQTTPEDQQTADAPENAVSLEETIAAFQKILLRDLKLMKHRQVIHPVLQEVGLKMTLLDPTQAIDLQYLGVRLPIPHPGVHLEPLTQELSPSQGVSAAFVSRTGKTTDVTQIKGWREKFTPAETPSIASSSRQEVALQAGPSSETQKKNLSAFCSDMLDEYLENEGKLIDERAASFSQPPVEPLIYELPTRSSSYVRTLDHILRKQTPASDLISGFVPPSKRPRLSDTKAGRRVDRKQKGPRANKLRAETAAAPFPESILTPGRPPSDSAPDPTPARRRKLKPKTSSLTLSPRRSTVPPPGEDLAPLESDSELGPSLVGPGDDYSKDTGRRGGRPPLTRTLLRQRDLEDNAVWEGQPPTSITQERAAIALTSLFTLTGFVSENPTAPIQFSLRRAPPCLNASCRLGCVCSSLSRCSRISHCGRPPCMFGCSCLKQKVVLLKNLDGSDSSPPSHHGNNKRRKRRKRMKMAYILKEADSVSQPAERVQTLWRKDGGGSDPEPVRVPKAAPQSCSSGGRQKHSSCARVRGFRGKLKEKKDMKRKAAQLKSLKRRDLVLKGGRTRTSSPPPGESVPPPSPALPPSVPPLSPPAESTPTPSKRLFILADCQWASDSDRSHVLKELCEAMAQDRLGKPFWIRKYLISPISQTAEGSGADHCIHYRILISRPRLGRVKPSAPVKPSTPHRQTGNEAEPPEDCQREGTEEAEPLENCQREGTEEVEPLENCQREGMEEVEPLENCQREGMEEAEPLEKWQQEVEDGDIEEEAGCAGYQLNDGKERSSEMRSQKKKMVSMALPFLTGISPAGFLSANRKQPGGTDHLIQVNGKLYPLAKIQLGKMGALHPANRLAAYLTGRVASNRQQRSSSSSCEPPRSSAPTTKTVSLASSVLSGLAAAATTTTKTILPIPQPPVAALPLPTPSADQPANHLVVRPVNLSPHLAPVKPSQVIMVQVPGPRRTVPLSQPTLAPPGQRMVLQPVQMMSGLPYYRRPDGKLVQLVPLSQVKAVSPNLPVQKGSSSSSILSAASFQTPVVTVSSSVPPLPTPLPQKGGCTFKVLPSSSSRNPIIVTYCKAPPLPPTKVVTTPGSFTLLQPHARDGPTAPLDLISLKPSSGQGAEVGVKTVTMSPVPLGSEGVLVQQNPAQGWTCPAVQTPTETTQRPTPPAGSEVTPAPPSHPSSEPQLACNPVDLDIVCVDDEMGLVTAETQLMDVVQLTSSSETENSSDFRASESEDEKQPITKNHRHFHSLLERKRRMKLQQLLDSLRREVGLIGEKTSKINTLNRAVEVIQQLRKTETELRRKKRRLRKRRDECLSSIAPSTDSVEVVDLLHDTDELTDNSSDEERDVETTRGRSLRAAEDAGRAVAVETVENSQPRTSQRKGNSSDMTDRMEAQSFSTVFRALRSIMNPTDSPQRLQIDQACQEIESLQGEMERLKSLKTSLSQQREAHIRELAHRSGTSEQRILRKLQHLSCKQTEIKRKERHRAANQLPTAGGAPEPPPAEGGAFDPPAEDTIEDDLFITPSVLQTPQDPPTPVSAPPTATPVQSPVHRLSQFQTVPQVLKPIRSAVSHNAPVQRERLRTIPNILSRSKNLVPSSSLPTETAQDEPPGECGSFQTVVPAEVLSLVRTALPGQQVMTLSPLMAGPTVLQTTPTPGVASVTLNIQSLTNQQIHVTSLPHPPTAANSNNLLHLVQPLTTQQQQQHQTRPPLPPPAVSAGSDLSSDQIREQNRSPSETDLRPVPSPGAGRSGVAVGGPSGPDAKEHPDNESLTSLLDELVFLNQQAIATATTESSEDAAVVDGAEEQGHTHSPWLLQLDSDTDETVAVETEGVGLNGLTDTHIGGLANRNTKLGVLDPPPLLQMKVSEVRVLEPASSDGTAAGRGRRDRGVAWRPMPRLVPLGLRGNSPQLTSHLTDDVTAASGPHWPSAGGELNRLTANQMLP